MVWPFARSNGGTSSSVAALIAVEMNALISADRAAAVAAKSAMMTARTRTIPPITELSPALTVSNSCRSVRRYDVRLGGDGAAVLTPGLRPHLGVGRFLQHLDQGVDLGRDRALAPDQHGRSGTDLRH